MYHPCQKKATPALGDVITCIYPPAHNKVSNYSTTNASFLKIIHTITGLMSRTEYQICLKVLKKLKYSENGIYFIYSNS